MSSYKSLFLILPLMIVCACDKLLIKPDTSYDPEKNFEIFWNDINNTYPFFDRDKINWDSIYKIYRPQVSSQTNDDELFEIFKDMLRPLSDGHARLTKKNGTIWENERHFIYHTYFNFSNINNTYLGGKASYTSWPDITNRGELDTILRYGKINSDILYFDIRTFDTDYQYEKILDSLFKSQSYKAMILDVRNNGGGYLYVMQNALSDFTNNTRTYGYSKKKIGPLNDNFGPLIPWTFGPNSSGTLFSGKIVVLTNRYTFSAAEHCQMAMKTLPNVTVVGDTTGGALSPIIERQLPNGIKYIVVSSITYDLNMVSKEKIGIAPDITVITPASDSIAQKDNMLEKAIQLLQ